MANNLKRILAAMMAMCMMFSMLSMGAAATNPADGNPGPVTSNGVTVDKSAAPLDENDNTTVSLSVGATEETTSSDVVFVLDKSASIDIRAEALNMLSELKEQAGEGNLINVGVVNFEKGVLQQLSLTPLTDENYEAIKEAVEFADAESSGTNIHGALVAGVAMLEADTQVNDSNKHLVLVTDGVGYLWGADPEGNNVYSFYSESIANSEESLYASHETIDWHHADTSYYNEFCDMDAWYDTYGADIAADIVTYETLYEAGQYKAVVYGVVPGQGENTDWSVIEKFKDENSYIPNELLSETASAPDGAIYMVAKVWLEAAEKYNLYAYADPRYYNNGSYAWAYNAISNLGDLGGFSDAIPATVAEYDGMFDTVQSSVLYEIQSGTVTDIIGDDFDLSGVDTIKLTVGGTELARTVDTENTNLVNFGSAATDGSYPYTVEYKPATDVQDEQLVWTINVPVESAAGVKLSYNLTLVNKAEDPGEYTVPTNESAVLKYTSTNGGSGTVEFPVPQLTYTIEDEGGNPEPPVPGWEVSKSKTATNLDSNYESQVTLSLPSAQETLESDIVFVVDKSTSSRDESTENGLKMLADLDNSLQSTKAIINVGIIVFDGTYHIMRELSPYNAEDVEAKMKAEIPAEEDTSGTNMEAGLLAAQAMLADHTGVADSRKYVILISDGLTRLFTGPDRETVQIIFNEQEADGTTYFGEFTTWCLSNGLEDGVYEVPGNVSWLTYYNNVIKPQVEADGDTYVVDFDGDSTKENEPERFIPYEDLSEHAQAVDRAFYDAYQAYLDLSEDYHCYAICTGSSELGVEFMSTLNGGQSLDFSEIQNDIYYLLDAGSKVVDEIGSGKDNHNIDYNFDFINDLDNLILKVNDVPLDKKKIADNTYGFGEIANNEYRFKVTYYPNGTTIDGKTYSECFVWDINENVSNFAPVTLTYSVKLTNPQTTPGTYGQYDEDGTKGYTSLYTNNSATLYPVDSNNVQGTPENFAKPTVSYTVESSGGGGGSTDYYKVTVNYYNEDGSKITNSYTSPSIREGRSWDYSSKQLETITVGDVTYTFDHASGDPITGTNIRRDQVVDLYYIADSDIDDGDTPLGPGPDGETDPGDGTDPDTGDETDIVDPDTPMGNLPQTGTAEAVNPYMTAGLMALAAAMTMAGLYFSRKRGKREM